MLHRLYLDTARFWNLNANKYTHSLIVAFLPALTCWLVNEHLTAQLK